MAARRTLLYGALALVFLAFGWVMTRPRPGIDHIVLVSVDTLRADHLGLYGYLRDTSPFLDALAGDGVVFERAIAPMSTTLPSHAALLTAHYPYELRLFRNGQRLSDEFTTLAELLRAEGFATAGFASTDVHFGPSNATQGFDHFDEPELGSNPNRWRSAAETVAAALAWLETRKADEPTFLWIHLFDPHGPHHPPQPPRSYVEALASRSAEREQTRRFLVEEHGVDPRYFERVSDEPDAMMRTYDVYDASIRFLDDQLRRLYLALHARGMDERALWVVTADHGEGLGSHGWMYHGKNLYREQIRVPLIVRFPDGRGAGMRVERLVELVDVVPTLLEVLHPGRLPEGRYASGMSLLPLVEPGAGAYTKQHAFAQRRSFDPANRPDPLVPALHNYEAGEQYVLEDARYKYILRTEGDDELFDVQGDPGETTNLIGRGLPAEDTLRSALEARIARLDPANQRAERVDEATIEALKALGYVE